MKKRVLSILILLHFFAIFTIPILLTGQQSPYVPLPVPEIIQSRSQWCWAACSRSVLLYVKEKDVTQNQIAEYARRMSKDFYFGEHRCGSWKEVANGYCDRPNTLFGDEYSVNVILSHFGPIMSSGKDRPLTPEECKSEFESNLPFIFRIEKNLIDGHVMVFRGINYNQQNPELSYVDLMDPQSGYQETFYEYLVSTSKNPWTHTLVLHADKILASEADPESVITVSPNPAQDFFTVHFSPLPDEEYTMVLANLMGQILVERKVRREEALAGICFDISRFPAGSYLLKVSSEKTREIFKILKIDL